MSPWVGRLFLLLGTPLAITAGVIAIIARSLYLDLMAAAILLLAAVVFSTTKRERPQG